MSKNELVTLEVEERALELEIKKFDLEQRRAMALSKSAFFPKALAGDVASAVIIYDLSKRMDIPVLEVAQSIFIVYNKPSFETKFLTARLNQSGKIKGNLKTIVSDDKKSAYCEAVEAATGELLRGMSYSMDMAKAEGLVDKNGSKWKTMPELMLTYRAQSNFINIYFPEVKFGMKTTEEIIDAEVFSIDKEKDDAPTRKSINSLIFPPKQEVKEFVDIDVVPVQKEVKITPKQLLTKELMNRGATVEEAGKWCYNKDDAVFNSYLNDPASIDSILEEMRGV